MDFFIAKSQICLLLVFSNSNWAGNTDDRKSTTGGCFYVGANLVAWMSKKQNFLSAYCRSRIYYCGSCCSQLLWKKKFLSDYGISQDTMVVYCDNSSAIDIFKNPV